MSRRDRQARKQELLTMIQQQRIDVYSCQQHWLQATSGYDHLWFTALGLRRYLPLGGGLMAIWAIKRPKLLVRWVKRGFGLWTSWRMVKKVIHH